MRIYAALHSQPCAPWALPAGSGRRLKRVHRPLSSSREGDPLQTTEAKEKPRRQNLGPRSRLALGSDVRGPSPRVCTRELLNGLRAPIARGQRPDRFYSKAFCRRRRDQHANLPTIATSVHNLLINSRYGPRHSARLRPSSKSCDRRTAPARITRCTLLPGSRYAAAAPPMEAA